MTNGWTSNPLGNLCDILDSQRKPITKRDRLAGTYPYYGATGILDYVDGYLFNEDLVLVGEDGAKWAAGENTAFPIRGKCWVNNHAHVLRPHRDRVLDGWLIYYLTHSDLSEFVSGLTVPKLNQGSLREIPIPLPQISEQKRIIAILDKAFATIATAKANTEKNLANAHALFQAKLKGIFSVEHPTWAKSKLSLLTTKIGSGATPLGGAKSYKKSGISLIRSLNVYDEGFSYEDLAFLDETQAENLKNATVRQSDILLNITGASITRCCIVPQDVLPARVNQHVSIIRPITSVEPRFLHYLLVSPPYKNRLLETGEDGGSTRQALTKAQLEEFSITYPPDIEEQAEIADHIDRTASEIRGLESLKEKQLSELDDLKSSVLSHAFAGML